MTDPKPEQQIEQLRRSAHDSSSPLACGSQLGPYRIEKLLGAGGMGEVYRALDTRLGRTVAIKVLSHHLTGSEDLRRRFVDEARAIASLNHPGICALHDVGQQDGVDYMVMEYLDGESLAQRLKRGPLPEADALRHGISIAEALDQAHRHGIVHRDIKPGNIMLTKAGVKLLDFGLARLRQQSGGGQENAETVTMTRDGAVLGTIPYMAPEQVEGLTADARADIFACGCVLYEMLTGNRAFAGNSPAAIAAAILSAHAPAMENCAPPALARTLQTCWARDPDERWQSAGDLRRELAWIAEGGAQLAAQPDAGMRRRELVAWLVIAVLGVAGAAAWLFRERPVPAEMLRLSFIVPAPTGGAINPFNSPPAVSPDGRMLTFSASMGGQPMIWIQELESMSARAVPGTESAMSYFWSPDSRTLGFFSPPNQLKRVELSGGAPQTICESQGLVFGGTWNREGVILFSEGKTRALYQVPAAGGTPRPVTALGPLQHTSHITPWFLPDGRHFLFTATSAEPERQGVYVGSLDPSAVPQRLLPAVSNAAYAAPGYLLYQQGGKLLAQRFDALALRLEGKPRVIADGIWHAATELMQFADFGVSDSGVLVYTKENIPQGQLTWFDRAGKRLGTVGSPGRFLHLALSPDEQRVLLERYDAESVASDLWILDLSRDALSRLTSGGWSFRGLWSADGSRVAYANSSRGRIVIYQKDAGGGGQEELLVINGVPADFSRDGSYLVYDQFIPQGLRVMSLRGDRRPVQYLTNAQGEGVSSSGQLSPDSRWMAYVSDETKVPEVYLQPFPGPKARWIISTGGGAQPKWRADGKELYYIASDGNLKAVAVNTAAGFEAGTPVPLFALRSVGYMWRSDYAVARDGQRFLVNARIGSELSTSQVVMVGWHSALSR